MKTHIAKTYNRYPVTFTRGNGSWLFDENGEKYLDFLSGLAVNSLGHCHPEVVASINEQSKKLIHTSNLYNIKEQEALATKLCEKSFGELVFFCNSGTEAIESAVKATRKYFHNKNVEKHEFITFKNSFHGRTFAGMTATGQEKYHKGYKPLIPGFSHAELNDIKSVKALVTKKTAGIIIEPIQGEGGVNECDASFLKDLKALCVENNILLIFDEVQVGVGRTGKLFCYEQYGIEPDLMTLAKALAGGLPIGALVGSREVMSALQPGSHASTFGGNPFVAGVALKVLNIISDKAFLDEVCTKEAYIKKKLKNMMVQYPFITKIKGKGLIIGVEVTISATDVVNKALDKKLLINGINDKVLRLLPPLTIEYAEIDQCLKTLDEIFQEYI